MDLSLITSLTPPEFPNQGLNIIAKGNWELETAYGKGGNCLNDGFEENFTTCLGKKLFFPPLKLSLDSVLDVKETCLLFSAY